MEGGKRDETFFRALFCANTVQIVFLNNLKIVQPFENQVNAVVGAHMKE
jgi:hypothetical protein